MKPRHNIFLFSFKLLKYFSIINDLTVIWNLKVKYFWKALILPSLVLSIENIIFLSDGFSLSSTGLSDSQE